MALKKLSLQLLLSHFYFPVGIEIFVPGSQFFKKSGTKEKKQREFPSEYK